MLNIYKPAIRLNTSYELTSAPRISKGIHQGDKGLRNFTWLWAIQSIAWFYSIPDIKICRQIICGMKTDFV